MRVKRNKPVENSDSKFPQSQTGLAGEGERR
jgi:hypothetical protein